MAGPQFFFGAMSPYSWFAAERIDALIDGVAWRPVFVGGLFRAVGRESWGLGDSRDAKIADCDERARHHGLGPIRWSQAWPASDVLVARAMVAADDRGALRPFALAAMRAEFRDGASLDDPDALRSIAAGAGLDGDRLLDDAVSEAVKLALRERTAEAVALGVVGVPTVVAGARRWWGDDRLAEAAAAIRA
jgi:2-hydroxychromene-2-carboxylate isomerase